MGASDRKAEGVLHRHTDELTGREGEAMRKVGCVVIVATLVLAVGLATASGEPQPVKINKTKTENKDQHWASDLCAVSKVPPNPVYEPPGPTEKCHRGNPEIEQVKFQVAAPRPVNIYLSGYLTASTKRGYHIPLWVILLVDGQRVRRSEVDVRGSKPTRFPVARRWRIPKGKHMVELRMQSVIEEGLPGLDVWESTLTAKTTDVKVSRPQ